MDTLHNQLMRAFDDLPKIMGKRIVSDKLKELGIYTEARAQKLLDHILAADEDEIELDDEGIDENLEINFTDVDIARLEELMQEFTGELPQVVMDTIREIVPSMVRQYRKEWQAYRPYEEKDFELFKHRLQQRWGKGFDALRMLMSSCRDHGALFAERHRKSRAKKGRHQREALLALHMRGCQIAAEIMCLMENGYADGAMARWRTLHELAVVALLIQEYGDELAERYLSHRAIDEYKEMQLAIDAALLLGSKPPSERTIRNVTKTYEIALKQFDPEFRHDYGWAAKLIPGNKKPNFSDLEKLAGHATMRSHYKFASHNVHAGSSGISVRLSTRHGRSGIATGATNTGFLDPGQNTAFTLVQLTQTLWHEPYTMDRLATMQGLVELRNAIPPALGAADRRIGREERAKTKAAKIRAARSVVKADRKAKSGAGGRSR
ncbi:hypothetical protein Swit_3482 [Rhizorhabdus wittichii RW1]|uniref:Uncharacterized protein n=1 Tax=Rhizorhabdus wittichii (strain DSM 6014 / CCUG 31198 / JCM 15750 / NBRC 105917 / EY 4224 / RW1) TaxID=392499 RepID=A0A9J9LFC7_RHIWR|nr:hypothetical protein Swit_3482 [Rhizorhabdus wittichii RW1]